jgi:hypothetical protein
LGLFRFPLPSPASLNATASRDFDFSTEFPRKESLAPPPPCQVSWDDYRGAAECPVLGRTPMCKDSSKTFRATIAMSEDFPLTIEMLLSVLEVRGGTRF